MSFSFITVITISNDFINVGVLLLSFDSIKCYGFYNIFNATLYTATANPISFTLLNFNPLLIPMGRMSLTICIELFANNKNFCLYNDLMLPDDESKLFSNVFNYTNVRYNCEEDELSILSLSKMLLLLLFCPINNTLC